MAELDLPTDVIEARRAYDAADARVQELADALPSSVEVVEGRATWNEQAMADLLEARAERLRLLGVLRDMPWWGTVPSKLEAEKQLRIAARA
ncbi:hypothetical protein AB0B45_00065 [Nonomuraea sp. NPDC049152]|uniref:hypothetical protein n=1 Tax=Nonomuraea sp. NPDC049152 TaxID=3154350 RepID=UPI0033F5690A